MVFPNGIGFGYSTVHTDGSLSEIEYKFKNHSLDLTYTIGNELSLTLGAGRLVYGRGEQSISGTSYVTLQQLHFKKLKDNSCIKD